MEIRKIKTKLQDRGFEVVRERRIPLGTYLKLKQGWILNCYETGRIEIHGKNTQLIKTVFEEAKSSS